MNKFTMLVIEDDEIDVINIKRAFSKIQLTNEIIFVTDGVDAKTFLENSNDDKKYLILLDINMPRMNGHEFLDWIRQSTYKYIPVVVLTTSNDEYDRHQAYKQMIAGYIVKPVSPEKFLEITTSLGKYWSNCEPM